MSGCLGRSGLGSELGLRRAGSASGTVPAGELLDTAGRVDELLLAREVGVAGRADTDLDILASGAGPVSGAAGTDDRGFEVFGVDAGFHKEIK